MHFVRIGHRIGQLASWRMALALGAASVLAGCASMQPEALNARELASQLKQDRQSSADSVEPLRGPLSLDEAIARAIKYNAERRLKLMEQAIAEGSFEAGNFDMLPKLVASAGYRDRNKDLISRSEDSVTGQPSLANPSISSARSATTGDLAFSWSLLDFGQSYFAAKQNADRVLIARERQRKALHTLIQDVRTAYWRVVAAQALKASVASAVRDAEAALKDARRVEDERLRNPLDALRFQRQLLDNLRLLEGVEQDLSAGRIELASLISLPPGSDLVVAAPTAATSDAWLKLPITQLEERALQSNASIRESFYNVRIAQQETRKTMLRMFPGLSFNYGFKTSDDRYLINQNWSEAGAQLSFNLLSLLSMPSQKRLAQAGVSLAEQKRMVEQMSTLTQLHIARLQYGNALQQFERADALTQVESRIASHISNQAKVEKQSQLEHVSQQTALILAQLRRFQALAAVNAATSRLQASLGMEPVAGSFGSMSLKELTEAVGKSLQQWERGELPAPVENAGAEKHAGR